jgi:protein gp37
MALRFARGGPFTQRDDNLYEPFIDVKELKAIQGLNDPLAKVFIEDMSDLFHPLISNTMLDTVFETLIACHWNSFQILTKRSGRMREYFGTQKLPPRIWPGVSAENQYWFDARYQDLMHVNSFMRWFSFEPLLGRIILPQRNVNDPYFAWGVIGGESGRDRRTCDDGDIALLAQDCVLNSVSVFVKQDSGLKPGQQGRIPDEIWALKQFPVLR